MIFIVFLLVIVVSIIIGIIGADNVQTTLYLNKMTHWNFILGASFKRFYSTSSNKYLDKLVVGIVFFELTVDFYHTPK